MLFAVALPGRAAIQSGSPSEVAHIIGWNPKPPLKCAAAPCLVSVCTSTSVESMSSTNGDAPASPSRVRHTRARAPATADQMLSSVDESMPRSTRYSVESDATSPNRSR